MHRRFLDSDFHITFDPSEVCWIEIPREHGKPGVDDDILLLATDADRRELAEQIGVSYDPNCEDI